MLPDFKPHSLLFLSTCVGSNLRNQINDDDKLGGKLDEDDKNTIDEAVHKRHLQKQ